jgi:hypothetical protein
VKIHIWDDAHIPYTAHKFILDRAIIKDTVLVEQITFSSLSRLPVERFSLIVIPSFLVSQNISSVEMGHQLKAVYIRRPKYVFTYILGPSRVTFVKIPIRDTAHIIHRSHIAHETAICLNPRN